MSVIFEGRATSKSRAEYKDRAEVLDFETKRPIPPLLFYAALALWLGTAVSYTASMTITVEQLTILFFVSLILATGVTLSAMILRKVAITHLIQQILSLSFIAFFLGCSVGLLSGINLHLHRDKIENEAWTERNYQLVGDSKKSGFGSYAFARTQNSSGENIIVQLSFNDLPELHYGDYISARSGLDSLGDSPSDYLWQQGVSARASIMSYQSLERDSLMSVFLEFRQAALDLFNVYEGAGVELLKALLFGERSNLDENGLYHSIKVVGLAHFVAVSGAHLVILSSALNFILLRLSLRRSLTIGIQIVFILLYLTFTAFPISAIRAACMSIIATTSFFSKRRPAALSALALCVIAFVIASPSSATSLSFILSALSTLGILVFNVYIQQWCTCIIPSLPRFIREGFSITAAANTTIFALCAARFSQISLIAPLMNILSTPFFSFLCIVGLSGTCLSLIFPNISSFILEPLIFCSQALTEMLHVMAKLPFAAIPVSLDEGYAFVLTIVLVASVWLFWPKPSRRIGITVSSLLGALLLVSISLAPHFHDSEVIMLDVGQGDAFVIRSGSSTVLVDTGNQDKELLNKLAKHGIYQIDALIITHADDDHCGSLDALQDVVAVSRVCLSANTLSCLCSSCCNLVESSRKLCGDKDVLGLSVGDRIEVGEFSLEVIWPDSFREEGGNADSLSFLLRYQLHRVVDTGTETNGEAPWLMLFCGDAEAEQLKEMVSMKRLGDIDILKVGHHGSRAAVTEELLRDLRPELALISVGSNNRYGHPSQEVIELLQNSNSCILRSDELGDLVCKFSPDSFSYRALG